jgi:hypothetical protein
MIFEGEENIFNTWSELTVSHSIFSDLTACVYYFNPFKDNLVTVSIAIGATCA